MGLGLLFEDWGENAKLASSEDPGQPGRPMPRDDEPAILRFPGLGRAPDPPAVSPPVSPPAQAEGTPTPKAGPGDGDGSGGGRRRKRKPKKLPSVLNEQEAAQLLAAAAVWVDQTSGPRERLAAARDLELVRLGLACGLRVAELCSLRVEDLDLEAWMLTVVQGKGAKDRRIPIPRRIQPELRAWVGDRRDGYLFPGRAGGKLAPRTVQLMLKALAEDAGIKKRVTPHTMRHSFATQTLARGANVRVVQELLGHESLATTQRYTHVLPEHLRGAVDW